MIFIPGNVPSSKNSKIATAHGVFHSKTVKKYLTKLGIQSYSVSKKTVVEYKTKPNEFDKLRIKFEEEFKDSEYPWIVGIHFVRDSKRDFDFHNIVQIIADLMVAHDFIIDDNMKYFIAIPFKIDDKYYSISKTNPGVYIKNLK